jgi:alpha-L-arabinofuranosidase
MRNRLHLSILFTIFYLFVSLLSISGADEPVRIIVDVDDPQWIVSELLTGSHFVYAFERDSLYEDQRIIDWMQESRTGLIRWPGGTAVQHYHWDNLNGIAFTHDSWDPDYSEPHADPSEHMDVDEYIAFCRKVDAEPMIGFNIKSGRRFTSEEDSLVEARRLVEYCRDREYDVKNWYVGNECFIGFSVDAYIERVDHYGAMVRAINPDAIIIGDWKFGPEFKQRFEQSIRIACESEEIDVLEVHEKWGNEWGLDSGRTIEDWRNEFPLYDGRFSECIRRFHEETAAAGRSDVRLGMNEWGLGNVQGGDRFDHALVAADYLIEMFRNRVDQACYWNLNMGSRDSRVLETTNDGHELVQLNPIADVFTMFAPAMGETLLPLTSSERHVYGFAVVSEDGGCLQIYLLNKSEKASNVQIDLQNAGFDSPSLLIESFVAPGEIVHQETTQGDTLKLPPYSMNRIVVGIAR